MGHILNRFVLAAGLLAFTLAAAEPVSAQTLVGRVVDSEQGDALQLVILELFTESGERVGAALTGNDGRFELDVGSGVGSIRLEARRIGYEARVWALSDLQPDESTDLGDLQLTNAPVALDAIEVEAVRRGLTPGRELVRQRQIVGRGRFFAGAVLAELGPPSLTRYLADELGYWVWADERGEPDTLSDPANPYGCVQIFVNEWAINRTYEMDEGFKETIGYASMDRIPLEAIAAVEVYGSDRDAPSWMRNTSGRCSIINVWLWNSW